MKRFRSAGNNSPICGEMAMLLLTMTLVSATAASYRPSSAGAGYVGRWRLPTWEATYSMAASTVVMPCNYSGYHDVATVKDFGWVQYDWSDNKDTWVQGKPMDCEAVQTEQARRLQAAAPGAKVGLYQSGPKALPWFPEVREKLDDPTYSAWFIKFANTSKANVPVCTGSKCSVFYHDQTQVPEHPTKRGILAAPKPTYDDGKCIDECDCGTQPCGNYVWDFRNTTFQEWYVHKLFLERIDSTPGAKAFYIDDRIYGGGDQAYVTEMSAYFPKDVALDPSELAALRIAFTATMERLYDALVDHGAFAWQMLDDGPQQFSSKSSEQCAHELRTQYCVAGGGLSAQRATIKAHSVGDWANDTLAERYTAQFLLYRGPYAWVGYDWNGCRVARYPYPRQWSEDFGVPLNNCTETTKGVFQRSWTRASVEWDCNRKEGKIDRLFGV